MNISGADVDVLEDYEEFLSTETSDLVQQLMDEYTSRRDTMRRRSESESSMEDSFTASTSDSDEEYFPSSRRRSTKKIASGIPSLDTAKKLSRRNYKPRRLPDALKALLGQAAVCFASGKLDEAVGMCQEVIRVQPGHHAGYTLMSAVFKEQGQKEKSLEYGLLGAMLNNQTDLTSWKELATLVVELNQLRHALTCYERGIAVSCDSVSDGICLAVKLDRKNFSLYCTIFQLNASLGRMNKVLLAQIKAVQELMLSTDLQLEKYLQFAEFVYNKCCAEKKTREKLKCLKCYVIRAHSAGVDCSEKIADYLQQLSEEHQDEELILHTGNTDLLVKYGDALSSLDKFEDAMKIFEHIIAVDPCHALARLSLATLQQKYGLYDDAMRTLDLFDGKEVEDVGFLDDRLLVEQCTILEKKGIWSQYIVSGTILLAMYFKDVYSPTCFSSKKFSFSYKCYVSQCIGLKSRLMRRSLNLRKVVLFTLRHSRLEKLVKQSVPLRDKRIFSKDLWHIFDKICDLLATEGKYVDLMHLCCYGSQSLAIANSETIDRIDSTLLHAAIRCRAPQLIWNIVRYGMHFKNCNHFWNLIGRKKRRFLSRFICLMIPDVRIHRFALRTAANYPDSIGLAFINGNHSLVSVLLVLLVEYFFILRRCPSNPLIYLLIGVTLINIASRRGILQKCDCCMQGFSFLAKHEEIRGSCQEVCYNMGRAMHQMGVVNVAVEYYKRTLAMEPDVRSPHSFVFDLRPLAVHNLICMYNQSNNISAAKDLMQKYLLL
ncbi:general transcription factor 3C [Trichuris trichiura]|uniref:General transcription factor 3C n=1 Tax=Trichuris trichiura TaxID=36087 RepID=A0A077ZIP4_TRITR|nr:general transcription factor 3C [Trichuris trichiura]